MAWLNSSVSGCGLVSCDWFGLSCLLSRPRGDSKLVVPNGWSAVKMSPTAVWSDRFFILDEVGNKVATVLCSPRTPCMDSRRALVEIANRWLYADEFYDVCDAVLSCLPMAVTGLNRVDLCCDFEMTNELWDTYSALADGRAYIKALKQGSLFWQMVAEPFGCADAVRVPHCISFGGKESVFKWKVYYKWLELQQAVDDAKKPYISELWRAAGFDERCVWRVEVSVSGSNKLVGVDGVRIPAFRWYDDRVKLFCDLYADKFEVRLNQHHKDKRNDKVLPFLVVDGMKSIKHASPLREMGDSDPERRLVCKLWRECMAVDVQANHELFDMIRSNIYTLCEKPANVWALRHCLGVEVSDIERLLQ